jgi:integrase
LACRREALRQCAHARGRVFGLFGVGLGNDEASVFLLGDDRLLECRAGLAEADRVKPDARIFSTASGKPVARRNVLRAINRASERAGLVAEGQEVVGAHDLRHSLAGCAFALGLSPVEVSELLRHANAQVTMTVYAGLTESAVLAAGDKLAAGLGS